MCLLVLLSKGVGAVDSSTCTYSSAGCAFPDTNQGLSYTGTFGEDHDYASSVSAMSFTVYNGVDWGGTATSSFTVDNRTGLMWLTNPADAGRGGTYTWVNALAACEGLTYAGFTDWRLPNLHELMSIIDYSKELPCVDATYFPNTPSSYHWTSTTSTVGGAFSTLSAWSVHLGYIYVSAISKATGYNVRCVRGGP